MRIVIATGIFPPDIGGPATHASDLAEDLTRRGHAVHVLTYTDQPQVALEEGVTRWPRRRHWARRALSVAAWLWRYRSKYDVVYATGLHLPSVVGAKLARRPVVVKVVGDPSWERSRRLGLTEGGFDESQSSPARSPLESLMRAVRDWSVASADRVVVPSEFLKKIVAGWIGRDRGIDVIPNGVAITPSTGSGPGPDGRLDLVYVGRLVPHKRVDVLVRACAANEGLHLDIIGEGPDEDRLRSLIAKLSLSERVTLSGALPHSEVLHRMARSHVLVNASSYEGLPHAAIEALAAGTPVVATDVGGVGEAIVDGENGLLVAGNDEAALVEALERVAADPALLKSLTEGALSSGSKWRFEPCAEAIEKLLYSVTHRRPLAIFLAKTALRDPLPADMRAKLVTLSRFVEPVLLGVGGPLFRREGSARLLSLPVPRGAIGGAVFYSLGPLVALAMSASRRRSAIVCQSPYEAILVSPLRHVLPAALRPKLVVEVHGDWRTATRLYGSPARRMLSPLTDRLAERAIRRADRVRIIGSYTEDLVREVGYRGEVDTFLAFNDFSTFLNEPTAPYPTSPQVAFVGVFERYKGVDVLIDAWSRVAKRSDARLVMAGDGVLFGRIKEQAHRLGIEERIDLLGRIPRADVRGLLDASSCLVLPSRSEGMGLVILEAMARCRPVIASRVGGITELIDNGETGFLVDPEDAEGLAAALLVLLGDPGRAEEMGREGRRRVMARDPQREFEDGIERLSHWIAA